MKNYGDLGGLSASVYGLDVKHIPCSISIILHKILSLIH